MNNIIQKIKMQYGGVYKDDGLTIIKVSGTDNIKFLQGQLTNDLEKPFRSIHQSIILYASR